MSGRPTTNPSGACRQDDAGAALVDRPARCPHPVHRELEFVEGVLAVARRVLDRDPGNPGGDGPSHVRGHVLRLDRVPTLEVGVHRHIHGGGDGPEVRERLVERAVAVGTTQRPGEPGTRRRQRLEPQLGQDACSPHIPWVRHHEGPGVMQPPERGDLCFLHSNPPREWR